MEEAFAAVVVAVAPLFFAALASWLNRRQQEVIAYLVEKHRVLGARLRGRRLRLTDDQRRRRAARGQCLGRAALSQVATIVTPDTLLRWHRHLIAQKWTYAHRRPRTPGVIREIRRVVARKAEENPTWGYTRSRSALKNVGHRVARSTIVRILKEQGIPPVLRVAVLVGYVSADALGRDCWRGFLHDRGVDVAPLLVIDLATRRVQIVGCTPHPTTLSCGRSAAR